MKIESNDRQPATFTKSEQRPRRRKMPLLEPLEARSLLSGLSDLGLVRNVTGVDSSAEAIGSKATGLLSPSVAVQTFFLDSNGVSHYVDPLHGYVESFATALNDATQIVGYCDNGIGGIGLPPSAAFLYSCSQGTLTNLGTLGGNISVATSINASGAVVGYSSTPAGYNSPTHAVYWSSGSAHPQDLGTLGGSSSEATGINDSGQIVGYSTTTTSFDSPTHAFLLNRGSQMKDLGTLGGTSSEATAINASGQIVGYSTTSTSARSPVDAFLLNPEGEMQDLGTLYGYPDCYPTAINNSGILVGYVTDEGLPSYAFIYSNGQIQDLNTYPGIPKGWVLETATAIDDEGVVAGMASYQGKQHGYLLYTSGSGGTGPPGSDPSTTLLQASSQSPVYGQEVTLTATVQPAAGASGTPTGSVTFYDGAIYLGSASLIGDTATLQVSNLPVGMDTIMASYGGDSQFATSSSSAAVTVGKDATSVSLTPSANPGGFGQQITFRAVVSPLSPGGGTPSGSVTFYYRTTDLGPATLIGGAATLSVANLPVGTDAITASYGGDSDFLGNTSATLNETITTAPIKFGTKTTLSASPKSAIVGHPVTLTATVKPTGPVSGSPTGTVTFTDDGITLSRISLSRGKATLKTSRLYLGTNRIEVIYSGDNHFNGGMSPILVETITKPPKKAKRARLGDVRPSDKSIRPMQRTPPLKKIEEFSTMDSREGYGKVV